MFAKFSVKKPFTVLVGVILVIVLGVVSFMNMTPDLLPSIDLPYVVVMTSYPGATPEEVEQTVTKPIEQSMAVVENIKSIESTSSENYSMVMLEFSEDAEMNTVTADIREGLDRISGAWEDTVGTPYILKINPNMIPVTVAAVDYEGKSITELSKFVEETVLPKLEGIEGVASVSTSGLIEESVHVLLDQEKIDAVNQKVRNAVESQFSDAQKELDDAQQKLDDGISQAESGKAEIESGYDALDAAQSTLTEQLGKAKSELDEKKTELLEAQLQLNNAMQLCTTEKEALNESIRQLTELRDSMASLKAQITETEQELAALKAIQAQITALESARQGMIDAACEAGSLTPKEAEANLRETSEAFREIEAQLAEQDAALAEYGLTRDTLDARIAALTAQADEANAALASTIGILTQLGITEETLDSVIAGMNEQLAEIDAKLAELQATSDGLEDGKITIADALQQLEVQESDASYEMNKNLTQLIVGEQMLGSTLTQLESAQKELDASKETLSEAKKDALTQADIADKITISSISSILTAQNFSMPAGYVSEDGVEYLVRVGDKIEDVDDLKNLVLFDLGLDGMEPIRLSDVAEVFLTDNTASSYAKINGKDGVLLSFSKQSGYATAEASENILNEFEELSGQYDGLRFTPLMDQGDYIHIVVDSVLNNLLVGALLAILVLILFLKDVRPTLIVACSVPISVTFAIVLMYFSGVTLNMISLAGLAVGVGMLVDNSIVVIENIYRLRRMGVPLIKASVSGAVQVAAAVTSSTLTTICVFFPIVFVEGLTRQLFTDMALTIGYSLLASLIVALTLVPAMSTGVLQRTSERRNKLFDRTQSGYKKSVSFALRHRVAVIVLAVVLLAGSVVLAVQKGFSYMPEMDGTEIMVSVQMPEDTAFEELTETSDAIAEKIYAMDDVETVGAMLSSGMGSVIGMSTENSRDRSGEITMYALLKDNRKQSGAALADQIEALGTEFGCEITASGSSTMSNYSSMMGGSGIAINLYGEDLDALQETAKAIAEKIECTEGIQSVENGIGETTPELRITVDKEKAIREGLTVAQVYASFSAAMKEEATATTLSAGENDYDVIVISGTAQDLTPEDIRNFTFPATTADGITKDVKISDVASIEETETLASISRSEQRRYLTVSAEIDEDHNVTLVTQEVEKLLADYEPPEGVRVEFAGESETIISSLMDLLTMLLLGVVIVYLIMVAQFQSLLSPLIVMFTIPLAFTGGLIALLICGSEISVVAMIGFVMLVGVIVNNGIVLVDCINQLREQGMEKREAIVEAGFIRLRPVLMTALTTILAMLPLAAGIGTGTSLMQPVAIVCVGGLVYATFMTMFVVPVMYDLFSRKKMRMIKKEDLEVTDQ